jgi:hypothetical protein
LLSSSPKTRPGDFPPCQERHLRAGTDVKFPIVIDPADGGERFQMCVLHARHVISAFMNGVGRGKARLDIADTAFDFGDEIAFRIDHGVVRGLIVDHRRAGAHGDFRIKHRRQHLVVDLEAPAAFFGGGLGFGDHRGDALADEADHVVQHHGVFRVDTANFVPRAGKHRLW